MYFVQIEIDTFEVCGLVRHDLTSVRSLVHERLRHRGQAPGYGDFTKLMRSMVEAFEVDHKGQWECDNGRAIVRVRRLR